MASSYFFSGRQWFSPSVMSLVNDTAMVPSSLTIGNTLCIVGASGGGQPLTPLMFGNPADALATLVSGPLCDAVTRAFAPSPNTNGPGRVMAVRVGAATQATLTLLDGTASPVIDLSSSQWGLIANQTNVKIVSGSTAGKLVTVTNGNTFYTQDNLTRTAFTIQYSGGQASATMAVTNTTVTLAAPSGSTVATLALASFPTVGQLVNAINATAGFQASVTDGLAGLSPSLNGLDSVTATDVKTSLYSAKADLQAVVDWLNSPGEGFVVAVRHTGAGAPPTNLATTYLTGGTSPAPITGDWTNAFTLLQGQDVQWIVPLVGDPSIHAAIDAHVQFMSNAGRKERRALVGPPSGTTTAQALALPFALNSDRTGLCFPGYYAFNAAGQRTLYDPFMTAALVGAGFAGLSPGDAMTNKVLNVNGLELQLKDPVDTDALIQAGVLAVMQTVTGFKVVRSISTWLSSNNFNRVEISCGAAVDFTVANVRAVLETLKGGRQDPITLGRAVTLTETALTQLAIPQPQGPGTLVGNTASPPFRNITASIVGDVLSVAFQCSPVIPTNFIPITVAIVPFSGTATSAAGSVVATL